MFFVIEITPDPIPDQQTFELILRLIFPEEIVAKIIDHYDYKVFSLFLILQSVLCHKKKIVGKKKS